MFCFNSKVKSAVVKLSGVLAVLIVFAFGLSACSQSDDEDRSAMETDSQDVVEELEELTESVKDFTFEKKEDASEFLDQEIARLDNKIDTFEQNMRRESSELSQDIAQEKREAINAIKEYRDDLANMSQKIKHSTQEEWQELQNRFVQTYNSTKQELKETWNEITNS